MGDVVNFPRKFRLISRDGTPAEDLSRAMAVISDWHETQLRASAQKHILRAVDRPCDSE